jgi:hypothetical protein
MDANEIPEIYTKCPKSKLPLPDHQTYNFEETGNIENEEEEPEGVLNPLELLPLYDDDEIPTFYEPVNQDKRALEEEKSQNLEQQQQLEAERKKEADELAKIHEIIARGPQDDEDDEVQQLVDDKYLDETFAFADPLNETNSAPDQPRISDRYSLRPKPTKKVQFSED